MCMGIGGIDVGLDLLWDLLPEEVSVPVVAVAALAVTAVTAVVMTCARRSPPVLEAEVLSINIQHTLPLSIDHGMTALAGPHWAENVADQAVPAAVAINGPLTVDVRYRVTRSERCPATTRLDGNSGRLAFGADGCPTAVGVHQVRLTIAAACDRLTRDVDTVDWALTLGDGTVNIGRTRHRLYFLFRDSCRLRGTNSSYKAGVWREILDHLFDHAGIDGARTEAEAAAAITRYCHGHGPAYASVGHYELDVHPSQGYPAKIFRLEDYLANRLPRVNCADQAQAITALSHALGIDMQIAAFDPFGFILPTNVVGIGANCNNPKPSPPGRNEIGYQLGRDDRVSHLRWGFFRHVFCVLGGLEPTGETVQIGMGMGPGYRLVRGSTIYDGCAGPRLGMTVGDYLEASIDTEAHEIRTTGLRLRVRGMRASERTPDTHATAEQIKPEMEMSGLRRACPVCHGDDLTERGQRYIDYMNLDETTYDCACGERFSINETRK